MQVEIGVAALAFVVGLIVGALLGGLRRREPRDWRDLNGRGPGR